jgi:hypothetical protein
MLKPVRIGLIDSGVGRAFDSAVVATHSFAGACDERLEHGEQIAACVLQHCPSARLLVACVLDRRREACVDAVVAGLAWLVDEGAQLINMSFGMLQPSPRLAQACRAAADAGVVLVAAAPARGGAAFPAALSDCIGASGDARCAPGEVSWLATEVADFGTHPFLDPGDPRRGGGASIASARLSGLLAARLEAGVEASALRAELERQARYFGPERRHA